MHQANVMNQFKNSVLAIDTEIEAFFKSVPVSAYCKDTKGKYLEVNDLFLYTSTYAKASDIVGQTDSELHWNNQAHILMQNDKKIIHSNKPDIFIENAISLEKKIRYFLSYKIPLLNRFGKTIGVIGSSFLLDDINSIGDFLKKSGFHLNYDPATLSNAQKHQELTPRQIDCLSLLVKGMTAKQIAKILNLAPKTIENHFAIIRDKLNCHSRHELITQALQMPIIRKNLF